MYGLQCFADFLISFRPVVEENKKYKKVRKKSKAIPVTGRRGL
jgi:hypothetical protein